MFLLYLPYVVPPMVMAATVNGRWQPGIGDPSMMGWFTTLSYLVAGLLCLRRAWICRRTPALRMKPFYFWIAFGILMLALFVNKQLDLQTLLTQTGREWSKAGDWYEERRVLQTLFIWALAAGGVAAVLFALWFIRGARLHYYLALFGLGFTGCFVIIRAASIHRVDRFIGLDIMGIRMNWVLELGGILVVAMAACVRDLPPPGYGAPARPKPLVPGDGSH